jgi:hypothetical protein
LAKMSFCVFSSWMVLRTFSMTVLAKAACSFSFACCSYLTQLSRTDLTSEAKETFWRWTKASASRVALSYSRIQSKCNTMKQQTYLGKSKETLGDRYNILHLTHRLNPVLDGLGVLSTGTVQNIPDTLDRSFGPITVRLPDRLQGASTPGINEKTGTYLGNESQQNKEPGSNDSLLVNNV